MRPSSIIFLATRNPAKLQRLRWLLTGLPLTLLTPGDVTVQPRFQETESSHEANAVLKAQEWSSATGGLLAIASDGGAVIPALGAAWDSLRTGRFAGEGATDATRLERLLELMRPFHGEQRRAFWVEGLAIAERGRTLRSWQVSGAHGYLAEGYDREVAVPGFWVATLLYFPELGKGYAQLAEGELARVQDPWVRLKERVQGYFRGEYTRIRR